MADTTKIEWTDATANFWIGCTKLSPACDNCYAEADWDHRKHRVTWGPHGARDFCKAGEQVVRRMQRCSAGFQAEHGRKPLIFVNSLSDFADNHKSIRPEWRAKVWQLARECPDVILQILTKRPQNLPDYLPDDWGGGYPNVWIGTTVENQVEADRRIPDLLTTPAAVRWLSCEPLLGPVDLRSHGFDVHHHPDNTRESEAVQAITRAARRHLADGKIIDWVVCGGESGPQARPMHPHWARSLRDQCADAGVPFFFKQWGEWAPAQHDTGDARVLWQLEQVGDFDSWKTEVFSQTAGAGEINWRRLGKKRAGRMLDGVLHDGLPA